MQIGGINIFYFHSKEIKFVKHAYAMIYSAIHGKDLTGTSFLNHIINF